MDEEFWKRIAVKLAWAYFSGDKAELTDKEWDALYEAVDEEGVS